MRGVGTIMREVELTKEPRAIHESEVGVVADPAIPQGPPRLAPADALNGLRWLYVSDAPERMAEHTYLVLQRCAWQRLAGSLRGKGTRRPRYHLVTWGTSCKALRPATLFWS